MPQQTNLNVAPYFDDFDATNDYHKVLFKPGYPVQARELTSLQSILQNQIEKFGQHFFKEGAKVIPGNTGYSQLYYCVQLVNTFQGVPVEAYADQLVGTTITGQSSGATGTPTTTTSTINSQSFTSGYSASEIDADSGDILYIENRAPITRAADQTENIKLVIEF